MTAPPKEFVKWHRGGGESTPAKDWKTAIGSAWRAAVAAEREACAKVAEEGRFLTLDSPEARFGAALAAAIRARGEGK